jgi:type IV secretion system protein VirD4
VSNLGGLSPKELFLGRLDRPGRYESAEASATSIPAGAAGAGFVAFDQDSHLLTIAPNRSGRDRSCLIPNLLTYPGQVVVVDLNGSAYAATAEARRGMGHAVVRLDPFGVTGPESDALDPLDLLDGLEPPALESACQDIADLLSLRDPSGDTDEYEAFGLLSAVIGYLHAVPERRSFDQIYPALNTDDIVYSLAVVLDTVGKKIPKMSYSEISSFLQKEDAVRSRILAKITPRLKPLASLEVQKSLSRSSVPLPEMLSGAPVTIYIIIPAEQLAIHSVLLRVWIGTLLHSVLRARKSSSLPMLFLLDYCAELGPFPLLESLLRIESGNAFRIWTFWHDVHQLRTTYPIGWPEVVSGCGAVQVFGTKDPAAAGEAEALLGLSANDVSSLGPGEQIVRLDGAPRRMRRLHPRDDLPRQRHPHPQPSRR